MTYSSARHVRGVSVGDDKSATTVDHDKIFPILELVMETVSGYLHLFPAHIYHMKATPRIHIQKFLIANGVLELFDFRRKIDLLVLSRKSAIERIGGLPSHP